MPFVTAALFIVALVVTPLPEPVNPETTEILDASGKPFEKRFKENRTEIPVMEMPPHLLDAIVAVEDDQFYRHRGIDVRGIGRAAIRNVQARKVVEGGSSLTQQLAKNLYLSAARTWTRKVREALLALKLEHTYSKKEILGMYWNTVYLGNGVYGVEQAAQTYFGKSARHLTLSEAALLAGLNRLPEYYAPTNHYDAAVERRNLVLGKMLEQGYISPEQARVARTEKPKIVDTVPDPSEAPYFVEYVIRELRERFPEVAANLHTGGYRIYTTLDPDAQNAAEQATKGDRDKKDVEPQVALVALEPSTGYIRALVGGREPQVYKNRALEHRQPGSAFKPFVYAAALETYSYTMISTQMDTPVSPGEFPGAVTGRDWRPQNFQGRYSYAPATMRDALQKSLNVVTARWMNTVKPRPVIDLARRMGIESKLEENLTIGLGSSAVTPLELVRAYAPFANDGFHVEPIAILKIEDRKGTVVAEQRTTRTRAIDPGIAYIVTDMLKSVLRGGGTASHVAGNLGGRPAAGKTGTSDDSKDAWFVGYTPDLVAGVWVGDDEPRAPNKRTGGQTAAPIWANFMGRALQGKERRDWTRPANVVAQEICTLTGLRPNASCPIERMLFMKGTVPSEIDPTVHWTQLPELPGMPWAPPGTLPPGTFPPEPQPAESEPTQEPYGSRIPPQSQ